MDLDTDQFVSALRGNSFGKPNALLIGFEASARLLGNNLSEVALKQLGVSSTGSSIKTHDIQTAWGQAGAEGRSAFLRDGFSARAPDYSAVRDLACLIRKGRIGAIIATDPVRAVQRLLQQEGVLEPYAAFDCCQSKLKIFNSVRESIDGKLIFIDAGETLIEGFLPGLFNLNHGEIEEIHRALKDTSTWYDATVCWGWSSFNTRVDKIWTSESGRYFVLGRDSDNNQSFLAGTNMLVVDEPDAQTEIASLKLLHTVAKKFCPELPSHVGTPLSDPKVSAQPTPTKYEPIPLLCSEQFAAGIIKESRNRSLGVIGIDGALVRNRLAALLVRLLLQGREMVEHEVVSSLQTVAERARSFQTEAGTLFWVVEFAGSGENPMFKQEFLRDLTTTLSASPRLKTLLLVPVFYAQEIVRSAPTANFYAESLTFEKVFVAPRVREWLEVVFPKLVETTDDDYDFAEEMCEVVSEMAPDWASSDGLDRIHLALNQWRRSLGRQGVDGEDDFLDAWREALKAFPRIDDQGSWEAGDAGSVDFEFRPRFATADVEDWDLRITSRPRRRARK